MARGPFPSSGWSKPMTFDEWLRTDVGAKCADYPITGGSEYLRNRLWWAFSAGQQATRDEIAIDLFKKATQPENKNSPDQAGTAQP
jgi:hypothetical protein